MRLRIAAFVSILFINCSATEDPAPVILPAGLDFSETLVLGGALSAGYRDGGLFQEGILNSYPNLLAQQLQSVGLKNFQQPLFQAGQENGTGYERGFLSANELKTEVVNQNLAIRSTSPLLYTKADGIFNNLAVPNLRFIEATKANLGAYTDATFNPFFERILPPGKENQSYLSLLNGRAVSFFIIELGWHDVMHYATSGGKVPISDGFAFGVNAQGLMNTFAAKKAKGILLTIPDVSKLPFFRSLSLTQIQKILGTSDVFITTYAGVVRKATANDLILLKAQNSLKNNQLGATQQRPIPNELVLDTDEVDLLQQNINTFNLILQKQAKDYQVSVVSLDKLFQNMHEKQYKAADGLSIDGSFPTGGFFAADGTHLTPRGQAVIANECLTTINTVYGINLPLLALSKFKTIEVR